MKDKDTSEARAAAPTTLDHISVGGLKRDRTAASPQSGTEVDGKAPGAQESEAASSGQRAPKGRKANVGVRDMEWDGNGAGCHSASS